jgi:predicted thioesterase
VDQEVEVSARVVHTDGRLRRFSVAARNVGPDGPGKLVGSAEVTRVVVDGERFMARISGR